MTNTTTEQRTQVTDHREGIRRFESAHPGTAAQNAGVVVEVDARDAGPERLAQAARAELESAGVDPHSVNKAGRGSETVTSACGWLEHRTAAAPDVLERLARELVDTAFDPSEDSLVRCRLISVGPDRQALVIAAHALALDLGDLHRLGRRIGQRFIDPSETHDPGGGSRMHQPENPDLAGGDIEYWRDALAGVVQHVNLPGAARRPYHRTLAGGVVAGHLPPLPNDDQPSEQGAHDAPRNGTGTLLTTLAAAVARYADQDEFVLGIVDRSPDDTSAAAPRIEGNWLPLPVHVERTASLRDNHARTLRTLDEVRQYAGTPFVQFLQSLDVPRAPGRPPLVQVLFEALPGSTRIAPNTRIRSLLPAATSVDLHLIAEQEPDGTRLQLVYNGDLLDEDTAREFLDNVIQLSASATAAPEAPVGELRLLAPGQWERIVHDLNRTDAPYPCERCLHELVREQAAARPEATAFVFEGRELSLGQVDRYSDAVAARLAAHRVGRGDFVPLLMDRSLELPITMLGVMKAGAAYVPMDVHWPAERIHQIVGDAAPGGTILTGPGADAAATRLPADSRALPIVLEELESSAEAPAVAVSPEDPIYMIYTSGSTGTPKGAINLHRGIVNRLSYMTRRYGCTDDDVILQTSAHIFDASVWQYFWPLTNGRPSILPSPMVGFDYAHVVDLVERYRVTVTDFVPSVFNILVDFLEGDTSMRPRLQTLRQLLIGGEALSPGPALRFLQHYPHASITNTYGPTEASIGTIFHEVQSDDEDPMPIGRPIDNVKAFILDQWCQPVPIGVQGRLHLGGDCVGGGYHNNPDRTAQSFPPTPFPDVHPGPLYDTGDVARYRRDGVIEFLGRADHQVKIRGVRVELGEIEATLSRHPEIQSAVVVLQDKADSRRLAAYYVPRDARGPAPRELRLFLKERLPEYIIPHSFTQLDELPLLRSGKVDRQSLPEPSDNATPEAQRGPGPRTVLEESIAAAWRAELNTDFVSIHDNFFELGGDSLGVVRVALELERSTGIRLDAEKLMIQTLGQVAADVEGVSRPAPEQAPRPREPIRPLYFPLGKERLYGCLHDPGADAESAVVLCPPLGHEYTFTHRAQRHLARTIAERGTPVLRFDYLGTGDSSALSTDVTFDACVESIRAAIDTVSAHTGCAQVHVVGLRLGSALAAAALRDADRGTGLVLWDPVIDGRSYLDELGRLHHRWLRDTAPQFRRSEAGFEVAELLGFPMTRTLFDAIEGIELSHYDRIGDRPALWIDSLAGQPGAGPAKTLASRGVNTLEYRSIPYPEIWNQDPYKSRLPHDILRAIRDWLAERTA